MKYVAVMSVFFLCAALGFTVYTFFVQGNTETFVVEKNQYKETKIDLAAVLDDNKSQLFPLVVNAQSGTGNIYINIDAPTFITDTQHSARIAVDEAQKITKVNFSKIDILLSMNTGDTIISGPSAGAAITIAIVATILNKNVKDNVAITGTIEPGGIVGPVGGILEKAHGAKAAGKTMLIVPKGESVVDEPVQSCTELQKTDTYSKSCTVTYKTTKVEDAVGIKVVEVSTVVEAIKLMLE